ncbi:MAG: hypothetical protein E7233_09750 [Lachnospiraceae bacterium]|nr:hypothetical protein [Lachnospiraceae bacterium]
MKIQEVIDRICDFHPPLEREETSDVIKYGDPEKECTGVAVTCFASTEVIRKAIELGVNFIITHEPTFFNDPEEKDFLEGNKAFEEKKRLLDESGMVIWRDHDHIHGPGRPGMPASERKFTDMIFYGIMESLGWRKYLIGSEKKPLEYSMPGRTVQDLADELMEKIGLNGIRIIGDKNAPVNKVFITEHINGRGDNGKIKKIEDEGFDAIIPLETIDWTIVEYVLDSCAAGRPRAILSMGHFNFEEPGMKYMADKWLPELLGGEVPVHFIPCADTYDYITR